MKDDYYWGGEETKPKNDNVNSGNKIDISSNHIYFYSDIESCTILDLIKNIQALESRLISEYGEESPPIKLHIHSYGGSIMSGWAGMDSILNCKIPIHTIVEGACASAGTFLSIVGTRRFITSHSFILIHQISSFTYGTYKEINDQKSNLDMFMKRLTDMYTKYTKLPENKLKEILDHDLWFDAQKCLEYGLVDKII